MTRSRVRSGLANCRARGVKLGRSRKTKEDIPAIFLKHYPTYASGKMNVSELARVCGFSRPTIYKYLRLTKRKHPCDDESHGHSCDLAVFRYLCTITGWKHARATVEVLVLSHLVIIDHEPCYMVDRILNICLELAAAPINNSVSIDEIKSSAWF